jgi:hypothetical protein
MLSEVVSALIRLLPKGMRASIPPTHDDPEQTLAWRLRVVACQWGSMLLHLMTLCALGVGIYFGITRYVAAADLNTEVGSKLAKMLAPITAAVASNSESIAKLTASQAQQQDTMKMLLVDSIRRQIRVIAEDQCRAVKAGDHSETARDVDEIDTLQDEYRTLRGTPEAYDPGSCAVLGVK